MAEVYFFILRVSFKLFLLNRSFEIIGFRLFMVINVFVWRARDHANRVKGKEKVRSSSSAIKQLYKKLCIFVVEVVS